jgi:NAD-dependent DNA ligase
MTNLELQHQDYQEKEAYYKLYYQAKEAYYNGEPIMTDLEFDELEKSLGLENKAYVGTRHNPSYTIQHPYMMGSLSKVQIKEQGFNGVDWQYFAIEANRFLNRYNSNVAIICTPKYDGCAFEVLVKNGKVVSISTRGDGEYGKDIYNHLIGKINETHTNIAYNEYTLRGEVLINKSVFEQKYSNFVNPRSFVAGLLNRDFSENDTEMLEMLNDLSIVIYDIRYNDNGKWVDTDWQVYIDMQNRPDFYVCTSNLTPEILKDVYNRFNTYRQQCKYALDGIVIKPCSEYRENNSTDHRPKDCVAVKFMPMLQETEIVGIEWSTGKTNELRPVIIVNPVVMDGKQITRASAHNYGYMIDNKISIGTKVILSLAGDIIPFIYKVTNTDKYDLNKLNLPDYQTSVDGCHLYKIQTPEEYRESCFIQSANALNIPQIGPAAAKTIYDYIVEQSQPDEFFDIPAKEVPNNILSCSSNDIYNALGGKLGKNAMKSFIDFKKNVTLSDVIVSCTFESCGRKIADAISDYLLFGNQNFEHMAEKAWSWCLSQNSKETITLYNILESAGLSLDMFKIQASPVNEQKSSQIPVILTGEPNDYRTKADFLAQHPEYRLTTSWKEVKIVFTNDLNSRTGKMKKAIEKNIEIRLY